MSELTISSFNPQISWPFPGATATLRYQYSADFVDSDGQPVLRNLPKDVPCTVAGEVLSVPSHTLITTNDARVNPLATVSAQLISARGNKVSLFQQFSIPESLTPTTTIGDLEIYNQGSSLVLPPDAYLNRDEVIALIATRLPNVILASDVLLGLTLLSVPAANPLIPKVFGVNDPAVGNMHGDLSIGRVPRALYTDTVEDGQIQDDDTEGVSIQILTPFQAGDWEALGNNSYIDVSDDDGVANLFAGSDAQAQYAGVAAVCGGGDAEVFVQSTDYTNLYGNKAITKMGDGDGENNGTVVEVDDDAQLIKLTNVPTSDPTVMGAIWSDSGVLKISAG